MTILGYAGVFTAFTYLAPLVRDLAGGGPVAVTVVVTAFAPAAWPATRSPPAPPTPICAARC